jgi:hypothetical protein
VNNWFILIGALAGGAVTALVTAFATKGKTHAEALHLDAQATDVIVAAAAKLVERQMVSSDRNEERLEAKINELETRIDELTRVVVALSAQLTAAGITPVVSPDSWRR